MGLQIGLCWLNFDPCFSLQGCVKCYLDIQNKKSFTQQFQFLVQVF